MVVEVVLVVEVVVVVLVVVLVVVVVVDVVLEVVVLTGTRQPRGSGSWPSNSSLWLSALPE